MTPPHIIAGQPGVPPGQASGLPPGMMQTLQDAAGNRGMVGPRSDMRQQIFNGIGQGVSDFRNALMDWRALRPDGGFADQQARQDYFAQRPHFMDFFHFGGALNTPGAPAPGPATQLPTQLPPTGVQTNPVASQMPIAPPGMVGTTMGVIGASGGGNGQLPIY